MGVSSASRSFVWMASVAILGGSLVIYQYLTRRTRHTVGGLVVGLLAVGFVSETWQWEFIETNNPSFAVREIGFTLASTEPDGAFKASRDSSNAMRITALPTFKGISPKFDFEISAADGNLLIGDETREQVRIGFIPARGGGIEAAMEGYRWLGDKKPAVQPIEIRTLRPESFDDVISKAGTLQANVYGDTYTYRLAGTIPLEVGARFEEGSVVRRVTDGDAVLHVVLRHRFIGSQLSDVKFHRVLLVNPKRKEMTLGVAHERRRFPASGVSLWGPLVLSREATFAFRLGPQGGDEASVLRGDWLDDAELFFLEWVPAGRYQTSLQLADFRTRDATFDKQNVTSSSVSSVGNGAR